MKPAARMAHIQPFRVMELLARARELEAQGRSIVHMEIGEPDFPTPAPVVAAGCRALEQGRTRYTAAVGLPELREAIAGSYRTRHGVDLDPQRVVITPGASGALHLVLAALVDPGSEVLVPDPGYPCNRNFVRLLGGCPRPVPVDADGGFQVDRARLAAATGPATVAAILASPANPTGTLLDRRTLRGIADWARETGIALVVDEIYQGLVYGADAPSALEVDQDAFVINSFSKYYGMTGWRLGWVVAPEAFVPALDKLAQNLFLAAPTPAQYAALAAFAPETLAVLEERRAAYRTRRDFLLPALRELGFRIPVTPEGAFYIYADCSRFTDDSFAFGQRLLEQAGVAITPGLDFGDNHPERYVRFAYTTSLEQLEEGVRRLRAFLGS